MRFPLAVACTAGTFVLAGCAERSAGPDSADPTRVYSIARSDLAPPEREPDARGQIVRRIECAATGAPPAAIVLAVGAGESAAEIRISTRAKGEC